MNIFFGICLAVSILGTMIAALVSIEAGRMSLFIKGIGIILVVNALAFLSLMDGCCPDYSIGERQGLLYKTSYKGLVYKSTSSELNLGFGNMWEGSTTDKQLASQLASSVGHICNVKYREWYGCPVYLEGCYEIVAVDCK